MIRLTKEELEYKITKFKPWIKPFQAISFVVFLASMVMLLFLDSLAGIVGFFLSIFFWLLGMHISNMVKFDEIKFEVNELENKVLLTIKDLLEGIE